VERRSSLRGAEIRLARAAAYLATLVGGGQFVARLPHRARFKTWTLPTVKPYAEYGPTHPKHDLTSLLRRHNNQRRDVRSRGRNIHSSRLCLSHADALPQQACHAREWGQRTASTRRRQRGTGKTRRQPLRLSATPPPRRALLDECARMRIRTMLLDRARREYTP
jgi:hypothetical protein